MLEGFFRPRSVAVVGVARDPGKVGHFVFRAILDGGYQGTVYPVNPKADEIEGYQAWPDLQSLPEVVDLAIVAVPAAAVPSVVDDAAAAQITSLVILSAGFKEVGPLGARLERQVAEAARKAGIRVLGPNSLGLVSTPALLNAVFAAARPFRGSIAVLSQSGALGTALLDDASDGPPGLAYFVSLGNRSDLAEHELLDAWGRDPDVRVVGAYLESVSDGRAFVTAAGELSARTPLLVLKAGSSDAGARAVSSHTGSLAGSDVAYDAALHRAGALRVRTVEELLDGLAAFGSQRVPDGPGTAILTNAGGLGVLATDAAERMQLELSSLDAVTTDALRAALPPAAAVYNPVDVLGDAGPDRFGEAARLLAADSSVHALLVLLTPQAMTRPLETARALIDQAIDGLTVIACFAGGRSLDDARAFLRENGIPVFDTPERAVAAVALMNRWRGRVARRDVPELAPVAPAKRAETDELIERARQDRRAFITDEAAARIAQGWDIAVPDGALAVDLESARAHAERVGYPVVLKISSPDILHKTDVGGVVTGIADQRQLDAAYEDLRARVRRRAPGALVSGVYVQHQMPAGRELIVGVDRDPTFGPLVAVGLGGVFVEALRDVVFRLCPVSEAEAHEMFAELRSFPVLRGLRGDAPADLDAAAHLLSRVSLLACEVEGIVEMDMNPVIVGERGHGAWAADIRIGIGG